MKPLKDQHGVIDMIMIGLVVILLGVGGYIYYRNHHKAAPAQTPITQPAKATTPAPMADPYAGWKTYTSSVEKVSFKYPTDWTTTSNVQQSNIPGADEIGLVSPSGAIKITWIAALDGLGGACDANISPNASGGCPAVTYLAKQDIAAATGLAVFSAITTTSDPQFYQPWLGVNDSSIKLGAVRQIDYGEFQGRHNASVADGTNTTAVFSTGGIYMTGPKLSYADASAWFNKPEVKQAKLILESLTY